MPKSLRQKQISWILAAFTASVIFGALGGLVRSLRDFITWTISFVIVAAVAAAVFWAGQKLMKGKL